MNVFMPSDRVEFFNPGFHVVACDSLALVDRFQIDLIDHPLIIFDHLGGNIDA